MEICYNLLNSLDVLIIIILISGQWYARKQASKQEDEEMLDMARPKVKPPPHLRGYELDQWHKQQNQLWQKTKKKELQKESGKCVSMFLNSVKASKFNLLLYTC